MGKYSKEEFIMKLQTPLRALTYSMPASTVSTEITWILYTLFIYRRPTLYPLEIAVDFLKSL